MSHLAASLGALNRNKSHLIRIIYQIIYKPTLLLLRSDAGGGSAGGEGEHGCDFGF